MFFCFFPWTQHEPLTNKWQQRGCARTEDLLAMSSEPQTRILVSTSTCEANPIRVIRGRLPKCLSQLPYLADNKTSTSSIISRLS